VRAATLPSLRQFVYGEPDGPVPFTIPHRTTGATCWRNDTTHPGTHARAGRAHRQHLDLAPRFACRFLWLTLKIGAELQAVSPHYPRDLFSGVLSLVIILVSAVRRHGSGLQGYDTLVRYGSSRR